LERLIYLCALLTVPILWYIQLILSKDCINRIARNPVSKPRCVECQLAFLLYSNQNHAQMELSRVFEIARNSLQSVSPAELKDFRLEQAEYDETKDLWNIVVSFLVPNVN